MRTGNPTLGDQTFMGIGRAVDRDDAMTIQGTVNKTGILVLLVILCASWTWSMFFRSGGYEAVMPFVLIGSIGGLIVAIVTVFKKNWATITAPLYAALEGLFLGGISAMFEQVYPGIVMQAVLLTFCTLIGLLVAYKAGIIRATENFKMGVAAATGGIFLIYMATMVLGFFGLNIPFIHESGIIGIGFSLFVVVIAALNLVLDFDFIENGAQYGAPKYMEWYGAFGLIVTLVWLYLEMLRLLSKLNSRD